MINKNIKVLIVDDSKTARDLLRAILDSDQAITVVGEALNGKQAVEMTAQLQPDVITMDLKMPVMDGFEATQAIMASTPTPIIVITSSFHGSSSKQAFEALSRGALDVMQKPDLMSDSPASKKQTMELLGKVKLLSRIDVRNKVLDSTINHHHLDINSHHETKTLHTGRYDLVAIASSTGGPKALGILLKTLPRNFPVGIVIIQHISDGFEAGMTEWLDNLCDLKVSVAQGSDSALPGTVLICPTGYHLTVPTRRRVRLLPEPPVNGYRPSGDILFHSVALSYGHRAIGVILTGMGADGAKGLKEMRDAGAYTIAQDESTCTVFGMPRAAIEMDAAEIVAPIGEIAEILVRMTTNA